MNLELNNLGQQRYFDDMAVGTKLPVIIKRPSSTMLFRFSAVTWNAHRIHYDQFYAASEAHPGVLVQATMHGAFLIQMLTEFSGLKGKVIRFSYSNRGRAMPGDTLTCSGEVKAIDSELQHLHCEVIERNQDGVVCVRGESVILLPQRQKK